MSPEVVSRVQELEQICRAREWTVAVAESCTGGLLSSWICAQPGVSSFYRGGVVSYAREVKNAILHVPNSLIAVHGEVSLPVAKAMAIGVREALASTWAVSVTGVAGPSGGTADKPVGFVCFAAVGPGFVGATQQTFAAGGGRQDIQRQAALFAFDFMLNAMR
jgi:PncC family amidohydrolase